ncbi:SSU ribosomal protein S5p [Nonlabens ulvanivorans]|nr:SSU ribosomal protein S5p [Nonlabens ulvanivorans]
MYQKYKNVELVKPSGLDLKDRLVGVQRVTKVTKGGRAFGFSAIVVVGDESGVVGHGLGKSKEVSEAISKAVEDAKKNLVRIPLVKGSIPHEQKGEIWWGQSFVNSCCYWYWSYCWWCYPCGPGGCWSS